MMFGVFPGTLFMFLYFIGAMFILLWPLLVWSHLREHTRYLQEIRDILKAGENR
jgi:hypothetical protein